MTQKKSNDSEFSASATTVNADATPLESQIADFFKEIDALSVPEELLEETGKPASLCKTKTLKQDIPDACGSESIVDSPPLESKESCHSDGQNEEAYCSWQEICDDSTGYSYYWNVQTNEVTWDCPAEYETYMKTVYAASKDKVSQVAEDDQNIEAKSKKMKNDNMLVPEGAIVPISYFGKSSSSDDSSDCESGSLKSKKKPTPSKLSPVKKIKPAKEGEPKCKSNDEESASEVIGPQLPPNFQFPQTVPVEHKNYTDVLVPVKEVEDFVEVDSLFSLKASNDMTEKPSQSDQNKFPVESSNLEISLESSLKAIENKFLQIHEGTIDESPDSTVKKGENVTRHREPTNYQASNSTYGFRPVVEYDNFTDEDEDICVSNISSSNQFINDKSEFESPTLQEQDSIGESLNSMKTTVEAANEMKSSKRKVTESLKESSNKEELIKRSKHSDVDIDSLFAAHTSYGKYGFGLGWQKQRQPENKELCSTSTRDYKAPKSHSDFKAVNFIKSNDILDLKALYDDAISDERNPVCLHASVQSNIECEKQIEENALYSKYRFGLGWQKQRQPENEELCSTSTRDYKAAKNHSDFNAVNFIKSNDILDLKALCDDAISDERNPVCLHESVRSNIECEEQIEEKSVKQKCEIVEDPIIIDVKITDNTADSSNNILLLRDKHGSFIVNKRKKDGQLGKFSCRTSLIVEEDLDEIDKALCDALDEKKGTENSSTKSLSPSSALENSSKSALESALSAVCPEKNTDADGSDAEITDGTDIVDDILQVSSALIDKLTVLLSTHSTLASLSGYFFQLQTRFVDWQAGALDSNYFMARLKEVEQYIQHYERSVVSGEWTCQWDRINKRYFYMNNRTQHSQWTYPEEPCTQEKSSWVQEHAGLSVSSFLGKREDLPAVSSSVTESQRHPGESLDSEPKGTSNDSTIAQWILHSSPPPPPPGVDSPPPPPPPQTPPPDSPPPPPPDSTEMEREPEDMDIENSNDSTSFLFAHNKSIPDDGRMQYISMMEQSPVINASIFSAVSSTSVSSCEDINVISKLSKSVSHSFDSSDVNNMHWSQPSCISQVIFKPAIESSVLASKNTDVQTTEDKCSEFCASSSNEICSSQSDALQIKTSKPGSIALKKEKKKSKILPGLGLKKKNIPSLVEKWQKIKEQQNNDDSDDSKSSNLL